ncbi:OsmC family protein [Idiomarina tyrosinivorans]|uniref:OsmC family protein n=1 Tax=Idiomarina tyrosinivorans TaxID=1445662 RepID=A0A432ZFA8_9GAMM|nr:OsmC family protein [Idiomarina tyrosinivorans]RUO76623.1 OsmC family protein [Idiomarina tyrosinivorans]
MTASVQWTGEMTFLATSASGHRVVMDAGDELKAPTPLEMVLMSAGTCASVDVVSILQKARQRVSGVHCELCAKRADSAPRVFTDIHLTFVVSGDNVAEKHVERAVSLSADKYCSVAKMLEKAVNITHSYRIETP